MGGPLQPFVRPRGSRKRITRYVSSRLLLGLNFSCRLHEAVQVFWSAVGTWYENKLRRRGFSWQSERESIRADLRDERFEISTRPILDRSRVELLAE